MKNESLQIKKEGLKIKAYYHYVDEFKDINYEGLECIEEDGVKTILFKEGEFGVFIKGNNFDDVRELEGTMVLVRNGSIFGKIMKQ